MGTTGAPRTEAPASKPSRVLRGTEGPARRQPGVGRPVRSRAVRPRQPRVVLRGPWQRTARARVPARHPHGRQHEPTPGLRPGGEGQPGDPPRSPRPRIVGPSPAGVVPPDGHLCGPRRRAPRPPRHRPGRHRWGVPRWQREPAGRRPGPRPCAWSGRRDAGPRVGPAGRSHHLRADAAGHPFRPAGGRRGGQGLPRAFPVPAMARSTAS